MATIPRGSLALTDFGDGPMRFVDNTGADVGVPVPNPQFFGFVDIYPLEGLGVYFAGGDTFPPADIAIFDDQFIHTGDHAFTGTAAMSPFAGDAAGHGYTINGTSPNAKIYKLNSAGTQISVTSALGTGAWRVLGVSPDGATAYYGTSGGAAVKRWDLTNDLPLSDFATESGGAIANPGGIRVLPDGTVLVGWQKATADIKHYDASGGLLHTYVLANRVSNPITCIALACNPTTSPAPSISTSFWVNYYSTALGYGVTFSEIRISDGAVLHTFDTPDDGFEWDGAFCTVRVDIGGAAPLVITCPGNQATTSPDSNTSEVVSWPDASASGGTPPYTFGYSRDSGSPFLPGVTTVTATVTDSGAQEDECTFTVTVTPDVLFQYGGALGFTTDSAQITSNAELEGNSYIAVGVGSNPKQVAVNPSLFHVLQEGLFYFSTYAKYTAVSNNNVITTGYFPFPVTSVGAFATSAFTDGFSSIIQSTPQQVMELVFTLGTYDPVANTIAPDGGFSVWINNVESFSITGIALGEPINKGKWNTVRFAPNGWGTSYYIKDRPERLAGYGGSIYPTPGTIAVGVDNLMAAPFTYPLPGNAVFATDVNVIEANNFSSVNPGTFFTPTGHWAKGVLGVGILPTIDDIGGNLVNGAQTWTVAANMLHSTQSGYIINTFLAPTPISGPTPPPANTVACIPTIFGGTGGGRGCVPSFPLG